MYEQLGVITTIDVILLSHNHYDHMDTATLKQLGQRFAPTAFAAAGDARLVGSLGLKGVCELDWWDAIRFNDALKITFVPARGAFFRTRPVRPAKKTLRGGYVIESHGARHLFCRRYRIFNALFGHQEPAGATRHRNAWHWRLRATLVHEAGPHKSCPEAVRAHLDLGAKHSIGMHFGTFQLTTEAIDQPPADSQFASPQTAFRPANLLPCTRVKRASIGLPTLVNIDV